MNNLFAEIQERTYARKVNIAGHSQGGLVARYWVINHGNDVRWLITVQTPHAGAYTAVIGRDNLGLSYLGYDYRKIYPLWAYSPLGLLSYWRPPNPDKSLENMALQSLPNGPAYTFIGSKNVPAPWIGVFGRSVLPFISAPGDGVVPFTSQMGFIGSYSSPGTMSNELPAFIGHIIERKEISGPHITVGVPGGMDIFEVQSLIWERFAN